MTSEHGLADMIAHALKRSRAEAGKSFLAELDQPTTTTEAYQVQSIVNKSYGPTGGFKVARKPGETVIMAPIYARDIMPSPATFDLRGEAEVGIELELGFKLLSPLPSLDNPEYDTRLRECVALVPVIEIVLSRLANLDQASPLLRLADNQLNGGLIVGPELHDWWGFDTTSVKANLRLGDNLVLDGVAAVPGGDAWENFRALAAMVGSHCGGLLPGHVAITGSLNGLPWVPAGTPVHAEICGLGDIDIEFTS